MRALLLRIGKSPNSWYGDDIERLLEAQWRTRGVLDLTPSVYEIHGQTAGETWQQVVRVHAEHAASLLDRPEPAFDYDISGLFEGEIRATAGTTRFPFANDAHREVDLGHESALRTLVAALLGERHTQSQREFRLEIKEHLIAHIAGQVKLGDPLWVQLLSEPRKQRWSGLVERYLAGCLT